MLKQLIVFSLLIITLGCEDAQKIKNSGGGGPNGGDGGNQKPKVCNGTKQVNSFVGQTFITEPLAVGAATYSTQIYFQNSILRYTQFCKSKDNKRLSPYVDASFSYYAPDSELEIKTGDKKTETIGDFSCTAEVVPETFKYSFEGNCLVLTSGKRKLYFPKQ